MIRVTSGTAKGKKLILPTNQKVTAVKEVVKLAIFSILGDKIADATCLDLYAGSGNLGIEALSRGADSCDFVDETKSSIETIEKNLAICGLKDQATVLWEDSVKYLANSQSTYDAIFADPYYTELNHKHLIKLALERLNPAGLFFLLTSSANPAPELPKELESTGIQHQSRKYGKTLLTLLTKGPQTV